MVTKEWNPAVRVRSLIQLLYPKKPKLANFLKMTPLTYKTFNSQNDKMALRKYIV